jgi:hypothetical protein
MADRGWFQTLDGAGQDATSLGRATAERMASACALRVRNATPQGPALNFWKTVGEALGRNAGLIEDSASGELTAEGGEWMDVRFEPDRLDAYRHAKVGQPLHTDGAYVARQDAREMVLFYMERQADEGGESLMIDAEGLARHAQAVAPELYVRLTTLPVKFGKNSGAPRVTPILRTEAGRRKVNWNYFRVLPDQGAEAAALREDFRAFLETMIEQGQVPEFRLESGEALFFRDDEVLHGRRAFEAKESGDRLLWKTYFTASPAEARDAA